MIQALLVAAVLGGSPAGDEVKVTPREIDDLLPNPGMGWQTFHRFADADPNLAGLPSSSAYFRFYWSEIEPEEGKVDFAKLDGHLAGARKAGQKLAFRVMCAGTSEAYLYVPRWLLEKGCPGFEYRYARSGPLHWVPDMDSPRFLEPHLRLIAALGKRYDGHPDLDLVDIGSVGLWGEWHMSDTGVALPKPETRRAIIDAWLAAFPSTPKVMLIGDDAGMRHAVEKGAGWRADCLGDLGGFSKTWNHMEHFYRQALEKAGAREAWEAAPVAFESCWDMRKWKSEGWDIRYIFDYALDLHASYLNNKSAPLPEGTRGEVERFLRKLGYRLVLREARLPREAAAGSALEVHLLFENVGVAPPCRDYRVALRLRARTAGRSAASAEGTSIEGWKPGKVAAKEKVELPPDFPPGPCELALAVVDPATRVPAVRLAIAGRADDGWYPLEKVEVRSR